MDTFFKVLLSERFTSLNNMVFILSTDVMHTTNLEAGTSIKINNNPEKKNWLPLSCHFYVIFFLIIYVFDFYFISS